MHGFVLLVFAWISFLTSVLQISLVNYKGYSQKDFLYPYSKIWGSECAGVDGWVVWVVLWVNY